jgi:head-tail adaptor
MGINERRVGALRDRLDFQARGTVDDGWGNQIPGGPFETEFTLDCNLMARQGREDNIADKLLGITSYVITTRWSTRVLAVTNAWQLVGARADDNRVFNVVSLPTDPNGKRQWLEFFVTLGKAS